MIEAIPSFHARMPRIQIFFLMKKSFPFSFVLFIQSSAQRLMMIQNGIVAKHVIVSSFNKLKAKIHIIIGYLHGFFKAAHFPVFLFCYHKTCRRNADDIICHLIAAIIITPVIWKSYQLMRRTDVQIGYACMLNRIASGVPQLGPHGPRMRLSRLSGHDMKPVLLDNFDIVV